MTAPIHLRVCPPASLPSSHALLSFPCLPSYFLVAGPRSPSACLGSSCERLRRDMFPSRTSYSCCSMRHPSPFHVLSAHCLHYVMSVVTLLYPTFLAPSTSVRLSGGYISHHRLAATHLDKDLFHLVIKSLWFLGLTDPFLIFMKIVFLKHGCSFPACLSFGFPVANIYLNTTGSTSV